MQLLPHSTYTRVPDLCVVKHFSTTKEVTRRSVLIGNNRPYGSHVQHNYMEELLDDPHGARSRSRISSLSEFLGERWPIDVLWDTFEHGLNNKYYDWYAVAQTLGVINHRVAFSRYKLEPLELLIYDTLTDIPAINRQIINDKVMPAGIIQSGSPLMLTKVHSLGPIKQAVRLSRFAFDRGIPYLGICFGFHMGIYARFGILPSYLRVPKDMFVELHTRVGRVTTGRSESPKPLFGSRTIKAILKHVLLNGLDQDPGLLLHEQGYMFEQLPPEVRKYVLAITDRRFAPGFGIPHNKFGHSWVVQAIQLADLAFAIQSHPELSVPFMLSKLLNETLLWELQLAGYVGPVIGEEFHRHPAGHYAGPKLLYNFGTKILGPNYIERMCSSRPAVADELKRQLREHRRNSTRAAERDVYRMQSPLRRDTQLRELAAKRAAKRDQARHNRLKRKNMAELHGQTKGPGKFTRR